MLKRTVLLLFSFLYGIFALGQTLIITTGLGTDTVTTCSQNTVTFYGYLIIGNDTVDCYWKWDMDDGTVLQGQGLDTVRYSFLQERGYRVFAYATYNDTTYIGRILVETGMKPFFTGTKTDLKENQLGICSGDKVTLTGKITGSRTWKDSPVSKYIEPFAFQVTNTVPYQNAITRKDFDIDARLTDSSQIDSIGLLIMHPNTQQVRITLTAPDGKTIILKDYGGNANYFGYPDQGQDGAKWYFWKMNADSTINALNINNKQIPYSCSYLPEQGFSLLAGTLFNGQWTIKVTDNTAGDDGYVLGWAIYFDTAVVADTFRYSNTYYTSQAFWNGDNVNITTNGTATAYPEGYGDHIYKLFVQDNFGCAHDTSVSVTVEQPDFSIDKKIVIIGDSLKVEDLTTWSATRIWDFGDGDSYDGEKQEYHKYFDKGQYLITLTAISENGCQDQDTAWVTAVPKPITLPNYNVFTPNGDGVNDVFSFFNKPEDKITAYNIETIDAKIYNRDGQVVCKWTTPEQAIKGWDGTINNNGKTPASDGYYYYIIIIKGKDGKKYPPFTGFIYLHR